MPHCCDTSIFSVSEPGQHLWFPAGAARSSPGPEYPKHITLHSLPESRPVYSRSKIPRAGRSPDFGHRLLPLPGFPVVTAKTPLHSDCIVPDSHRIPFSPSLIYPCTDSRRTSTTARSHLPGPAQRKHLNAAFFIYSISDRRILSSAILNVKAIVRKYAGLYMLFSYGAINWRNFTDLYSPFPRSPRRSRGSPLHIFPPALRSGDSVFRLPGSSCK